MKKAMVFVLICLVWGWTPSSGTTVISPAAESGTRSAWLSLLQGAGLAPESLDLTRGLLRLGEGCACSSRCGWGWGAPSSQPPLPTPSLSSFGVWSGPVAESGGRGQEGREPLGIRGAEAREGHMECLTGMEARLMASLGWSGARQAGTAEGSVGKLCRGPGLRGQGSCHLPSQPEN